MSGLAIAGAIVRAGVNVRCSCYGPAGRAGAGPCIRKSGANLRISRRAMVILCTSSGPSAMRRVRMWAYIARQREELGDAGGAVHLDGPVDDLERDVRHGHLDAGDLGGRRLVADRVHQVGGAQHVLAGHVDLDARLGDPVLDQALLGDERAEGGALERPAHHEFEGPLGDADGAHAVVDASRAEAGLGDGESAALLTEQVVGRHAHVLVDDLRVAAGSS